MKLDVPQLALVFCVITAAGAGRAVAEDEGKPAYSMEDVTACSADAMRLCKGKMPSIKAIEACMRAHFNELRPKCQARFR